MSDWRYPYGMIPLGPLGEPAPREQALTWVMLLDQSKLEWWRTCRLTAFVKSQLADLAAGKQPRALFLSLMEEGMWRVAARHKYIEWGPGPWCVHPLKRQAGFWPMRRRLVTHLNQGVIVRIREGKVPYMRWQPVNDQQKYWLVTGGDGPLTPEHWYELRTIAGRVLWHMPGEAWDQEPYGAKRRPRTPKYVTMDVLLRREA